MDIENHLEFQKYLLENHYVKNGKNLRIQTLTGGVSNKTVLVKEQGGRSMVVKQALPKLRVQADWYCDPGRIFREADGLKLLVQLLGSDHLPDYLFKDEKYFLFGMSAVPPPHQNLKTLLLQEAPQNWFFEQMGAILGQIHQKGIAFAAHSKSPFHDRTYFLNLRLDPYYVFTASRIAWSKPFYENLIETTLSLQDTLVHGDFSPKNLLVYQKKLFLLDHEVIHIGDGAFDLGFLFAHLIGKSIFRPAYQTTFLKGVNRVWFHYKQAHPKGFDLRERERRAVLHSLGCLLARVDGKSPLEYLEKKHKEKIRRILQSLMFSPPENIAHLIHALEEK